MRTADIRQRWLEFFGERGHTIVPSASLVSSDPSLLFTVAGMVPFIPYLNGTVPPPYPRAADCQKCIRTNDIEEVGRTPRHGTFFQMLGNWSFGDYFKEGAIAYAWELLLTPESAGGLGFDEKDLWVTVYKDDDEAADLWRRIAGLPEERIQRLDESSAARSRTGRTWSISYMFSTPCLRNATRSSPMPVSMFFFGRSPTMSKSTLLRTLSIPYCMNTRFQIST